jgi:carboxypeptidase family protein
MPSSSCPCTLRGSVVDSVSGQPVPHALVKLTAPSPHAALTDSEGKFQFEGLPAGSVTLEAIKPGFLGNSSGPLPGSVSSIEFGPATLPATLKLIPEGAIAGEVSDENGEPLEGFTITVLSRGPQSKRLYPDPWHRAVTDDEGKFRISGLGPGSYFLLARQNQVPALATSGKVSVPSGYSPVFYPGSSEPASAVLLKVLPGRTLRANFSLKRESFIRLSGTVSGYAPQEHVSLMLQDSFGAPQNSEIIFDNASGLFHTKWITPGTHTLIASSVTVDGDASSAISFASLHINAASDLSNLRLVLQRTTIIPANVRIRSSASSAEQQPPVVQMFLGPRDSQFITRGIPFVPSAQPESPEFTRDSVGVFPGVRPGTYELTFAIGATSSSYYLDSATWGSADLLRDDLVLDSSGAAPPIEVVLRDDAATLNGRVALGDPPVAAMIVVLSDRRKPLFLYAGPNGKFTFSALPPGVYRVFAVDSSTNLDYQDSASLAKISSKIQEITLTPKQSASINLELATVEE